MLHNLMVPLDGSPFAEAALPTACALARRDSAHLKLVMVREPRLPITRAGGAPVRDPALDEELWREDRRYLEVLLGRLEAGDRARISTQLLEGPIVETLARQVQEAAVDLVVMTTHARGGVRRAWLGSVADGLVRHSPAPILLLRPGASAVRREAGEFRRVLLPLDGSIAGETIIQWAIEVAGTQNVQYTLLRVLAAEESPARVLIPHRGETPSGRTQRATVEAVLEGEASLLRSHGVNATAQTVVHGSAGQAILRHAEANEVDLIAMNTRSRGGLERLVLGSVADTVLRKWQHPLLLFNPGEP